MTLRFSIKALLFLVALIAVSCVALVSPSQMWSAVFFTAATLMVLAAMVAAVVCRGQTRAFWIGFVIVGGGYLYIVTTDAERGLNRGGLFDPRLLTTQLLIRAYELLGRLPQFDPSNVDDPMAGITRMNNRVVGLSFDAANFIRIGNSMFAILFAYVGGRLGLRCWTRDAIVDSSVPEQVR